MEETNNCQLKKGDKVRIVVYGEVKISFNMEDGGYDSLDIMPYLVGREGIIDKIIGTKFPKYYIAGIQGKYGPYNEEQLQKI